MIIIVSCGLLVMMIFSVTFLLIENKGKTREEVLGNLEKILESSSDRDFKISVLLDLREIRSSLGLVKGILLFWTIFFIVILLLMLIR